MLVLLLGVHDNLVCCGAQKSDLQVFGEMVQRGHARRRDTAQLWVIVMGDFGLYDNVLELATRPS